MDKFSLKKLSHILGSLAENAWIAYGSIILLQLKVMQGIWAYRDLTPGDTSSYYKGVYLWLDETKIDIAWSPLYTIFLAALHSLTDNPFWSLTIAQISIAVCGTILVLILLRRLLPSHIAWIIAAWWALLPINFDTVYNVHLFSALFPIALFVIAAYKNNIWGRGIVLGGLLLTAILVRTEYIALFMLWLLAIAGYEFYVRLRKKDHAPSLKAYFSAYGLPILVGLVVIGSLYSRADPKYPELQDVIEGKHTANVCQIYAYNRLQQGDSWQGSPWTECQDIIERDFGRPDVTFFQALYLNPRAILKHIWWNIKLIPSGTQLALFSYYAGGTNPDYMPTKSFPLIWLPFSLIISLCLFAAVTHLLIPVFKKKGSSVEIKLVWLLMASAALMGVGIMMMQRPRPSFVFPYTLFLMALAGLGLHDFFKLIRVDKFIKTWLLLPVVLMILFVPSYYDADYVDHFGNKGQGWRNLYESIAPHITRTSVNSTAVAVPSKGEYESLCNYLGVNCREPGKQVYLSHDPGMPTVLTYPEDNIYVLYLEEMIWKFGSLFKPTKKNPVNYVELICFGGNENIINCKDGTIDLARGVMNDGARDIPLLAAFFINNGYVARQNNYRTGQGYYLQIIMKNNKIYTILVADDRLFRTNFNQQYLLGNYDRRYFEEVYNNFLDARLIKVKKQVTP